VSCCHVVVVLPDAYPFESHHVFKKEYKLIPLEAVENFTKENSHLPNMPTESEVIKDGLDLSDVIIKNTENIEQLYLYLFELKKEIECLKLENDKLKTKLK
jgi:hypothetical protein